MQNLEALKMMLERSHRIVFFTGAGISTGSGIPDFRSAQGLYTNNKRAEEIISHSYFYSDTDDFYKFYKTHMCFKDAKPNIAHKWIAALEKEGKSLGVVTQNIDGLHQAAGSAKVIELHGSIYQNHCLNCHKAFSLDYILESKGVPYCDECGGIIKPDVTLYEEPLEENAVLAAIDMISAADCLIIIGTSLLVYPAASYIEYFRGRDLIIINKGETKASRIASLVISDDVCEVVRRLSDLCEK